MIWTIQWSASKKLTESSLIKSFAIYNAPFEQERQLAVFDASKIAGPEDRWEQPHKDTGLYRDAKSLIRIVPQSEGDVVDAPNVDLKQFEREFDVKRFRFFSDFFLCGRDRSVCHVQLATMNKLFRIRNAPNIFVGTLVYRVTGENATRSKEQRENWMGGVVRGLDGEVKAIVVRVAGPRIFAAKVSRDFAREWSFEKPPKFTLSSEQRSGFHRIKDEAFFMERDS